MDNHYYGYYATQVGAASKYILTVPQSDLKFPPTINYDGRNYRFITSYTCSTPGQLNSLIHWAQNNNVETEIEINT